MWDKCSTYTNELVEKLNKDYSKGAITFIQDNTGNPIQVNIKEAVKLKRWQMIHKDGLTPIIQVCTTWPVKVRDELHPFTIKEDTPYKHVKTRLGNDFPKTLQTQVCTIPTQY